MFFSSEIIAKGGKRPLCRKWAQFQVQQEQVEIYSQEEAGRRQERSEDGKSLIGNIDNLKGFLLKVGQSDQISPGGSAK